MATRRERMLKQGRERRRQRVRAVVRGTLERPRLAVFRSNKAISAQLIDDLRGATMATASEKDVQQADATPVERAHAVGKVLAEKAKKQAITKVVFDRRGYQFHGRVKALADGAREGGLHF